MAESRVPGKDFVSRRLRRAGAVCQVKKWAYRCLGRKNDSGDNDVKIRANGVCAGRSLWGVARLAAGMPVAAADVRRTCH